MTYILEMKRLTEYVNGHNWSYDERLGCLIASQITNLGEASPIACVLASAQDHPYWTDSTKPVTVRDRTRRVKLHLSRT